MVPRVGERMVVRLQTCFRVRADAAYSGQIDYTKHHAYSAFSTDSLRLANKSFAVTINFYNRFLKENLLNDEST